MEVVNLKPHDVTLFEAKNDGSLKAVEKIEGVTFPERAEDIVSNLIDSLYPERGGPAGRITGCKAFGRRA